MDADAWNQRYDTTELIWRGEPNRWVAAEVADLAPGRALDLACGEGRNAVWLAGRGWDVLGVDFAELGLAKARRLAEGAGVDVTWERHDLTAWLPPTGAFDLVVHAYLHLPQPQRGRVVGAAARALAPGGTFVLVAHDRTNLADGHGGPQDETVLPTPDEVAGELEAADPDLVVSRAEVLARTVDTDDGERTALDTLVRAHRPAG